MRTVALCTAVSTGGRSKSNRAIAVAVAQAVSVTIAGGARPAVLAGYRQPNMAINRRANGLGKHTWILIIVWSTSVRSRIVREHQADASALVAACATEWGVTIACTRTLRVAMAVARQRVRVLQVTSSIRNKATAPDKRGQPIRPCNYMCRYRRGRCRSCRADCRQCCQLQCPGRSLVGDMRRTALRPTPTRAACSPAIRNAKVTLVGVARCTPFTAVVPARIAPGSSVLAASE